MTQGKCSVYMSKPIGRFRLGAYDIDGLSQKHYLSQVMPLTMASIDFWCPCLIWMYLGTAWRFHIGTPWVLHLESWWRTSHQIGLMVGCQQFFGDETSIDYTLDDTIYDRWLIEVAWIAKLIGVCWWRWRTWRVFYKKYSGMWQFIPLDFWML